jgi:cell growth-regulating nucleolar protein
LTKKKLDPHRNQCYGASFTCIDCMVHFQGTDYRSHTSCISEAQKYQGHLYREKDNKKGKRKGNTQQQDMIPRGAYVEDAPEGDDMNAVAVIDVPPRAPTPPPAPEAYGELPENVNVFDYLVSDATPKGAAVQAPDERKMLGQSTPHAKGGGSHYQERGFSYGSAPIEPSFQRYDSYNNLAEAQQMPPPNSAYVTPAPKEHRREKKEKRNGEKSDKKRKRNVEELDLSSAKRPQSREGAMQIDPPQTVGRVLHSGLTGGLSRLVTDPEFYDDRIDAGPTPISPVKRSKREKERGKDSKEDRRDRRMRSRSPEREKRKSHRRRSESVSSTEDRSRVSRRGQEQRRIEYHGDPQPSANNQVMSHNDRADLFMSFITKGPESERGCSINKVLKRYHRERDARDDEDKELWKSLRVRRNSRGEIVLFA